MRFGWCTGIQNLSLAQEIGFDYLECPAADLAALPDEEFETVRREAERSEIGVECVNILFPGEISLFQTEDAALRSYLEKAFERAAALGAELAVLGSGRARNCPPEMDFLEGCRRLVQATRMIGETAARHGLILAVEPLNRKESNLIHTVGEAALLAAQVNLENVRLLADAYHLFQENDCLEDLKRVGNLVHTHVATPESRAFPVDPDPRLERFFSVLGEMGYDGRMSVEGNTSSPETDGPRALAALRELCAKTRISQ